MIIDKINEYIKLKREFEIALQNLLNLYNTKFIDLWYSVYKNNKNYIQPDKFIDIEINTKKVTVEDICWEEECYTFYPEYTIKQYEENDGNIPFLTYIPKTLTESVAIEIADYIKVKTSFKRALKVKLNSFNKETLCKYLLKKYYKNTDVKDITILDIDGYDDTFRFKKSCNKEGSCYISYGFISKEELLNL